MPVVDAWSAKRRASVSISRLRAWPWACLSRHPDKSGAEAPLPQKLVAFVALVVTTAGRYLFDGLARVGENNGSARFRLIASDNDIDVERIQVDALGHTPRALADAESLPGVVE